MNGEPFDSEAWDQRQPFDGTALYCVLCNWLEDEVEAANCIVEGYSLCAEHASAVVKRASYIWFDGSDRLNLRATIENNKEAST
jgi:hypothetical protein